MVADLVLPRFVCEELDGLFSLRFVDAQPRAVRLGPWSFPWLDTLPTRRGNGFLDA
jgi:hypothetical protein